MKKFLQRLANAPRRTAGILMVAAAVIVPTAMWAWGPERPTYTYGNPAPHVTFNSITDNPDVGDERDFVRIREDAEGKTFGNTVALEAGKTYEVMVFYHNNAAPRLNEGGQGIAQNAKARIQMPGRVQAGQTATITGFVSADNAQPQTVWDEARGTTKSDIALRYVQNSAKIASSNGAVNGAALSNDLFGSGVKLGYNALDGKLPGCNQFSGYITYKFVVDKPGFDVEKKVSTDGGRTWHDEVTSKPGNTVTYRLKYQNTGTVQQNNVIFKDELPKGMTYVPGSTMIANSRTNGQYQSTVDGVTSEGGYNTGSYTPRGNVFMIFRATIAANDRLEKCGNNLLKNRFIVFTENGNKSDEANVKVSRECKPVYACDSLTVTKRDRTTFQFSTRHSSKYATFKHATYVVRDSQGRELYRGPNATYTQERAGNYTVQAYVTFTVNGQDRTVTSESCKKSFVVVPPKTPGVEIDKKVDGVDHKEVSVNQEFTYTIVVRNTGEVNLSNVRVNDPSPEQVEFLRADRGTIENGTWKFTIPKLKIGESEHFEITARVTKEVDGNVVNVACVDAPQIPGSPDDCDVATVEVPKKVVPPTPAIPGTPAELPQTGAGSTFITILSIGAIVAAISYAVTGRRAHGSI